MNTNLIYTISLPSKIEEGKKYPVIYAMHGMGSNERDIRSVIEVVQEDFIILAIRGPIPLNNGFAYFTIKSYGNPDVEPFETVIEQLASFIQEAPSAYPIDVQQQFLFGFSQGAILSMSLALKLGNQIKGIVALSGYIPKHVRNSYPYQSLKDVAIFIGHGEKDSIFPVTIGEENEAFLKERSDQVTFKTYPIGHEVSLPERADYVAWLRAQQS